MPVYDFRCTECELIFERICTWDSTDIQVCPSCMSENTERQFPSPSIVRSSTLFARQKVPTDFKQGVLEPMKKFYEKRGHTTDAIKI